MTRTSRLLSLALMVVMVASCGGKKQPALSPVETKITSLNAMASEAFKKGDYDRAYRLYSEAMKHAVSIERTRSIAINTINAANSLRMLEKYDEADALLEPLVGESVLEFSPKYRSRAAYLRATLRTGQGRAREALDWATRSIEICNQAKCRESVGVYVVMARAYLMMGDNEMALSTAEKAAGMSSSARRKPERASALRVQAEALLNLGESARALALFDEAVRLDKQLGISSHIAANLYGSARALEALGRTRDAELMYYRALAVSTASGNGEMMKLAEDALHRLNP